MSNNILIDYAPISFSKNLLMVFIKVFLVFLGGWFLFYAISNDIRKEYIINHSLFTVLIFFIVISIALLQTWFNSKIYIYQVSRFNETLVFKWQELKSIKEVSIPIKDVIVKMKPSGKNTPYLEIKLQTEVLKQTFYPGWNKETMEDFVKKINELKAT